MQFAETTSKVVVHAPRQFTFLSVAQEQQAALQSRVPQSYRFFQGAERQKTGATFQSRARHGKRAMPVALVLYNREHLQAGRFVLVDEFEVALKFPQIDLDPGGS